MAGLDVGKISEEIARYFAKGWTKERIRPYLPMLRDELKRFPLEEKITLAVTLREKFPDLADIINELVEVPPHPQQSSPPPPESNLPELTEDEEAQIAQYAEQRSNEGELYRKICEEVNARWRTDFLPRELSDLVSGYRVVRYQRERKVKLQATEEKVAALQALITQERKAHQEKTQSLQEELLKTKEAGTERYLSYRDSLILRWGASLVGALCVGLAVGRLLH